MIFPGCIIHLHVINAHLIPRLCPCRNQLDLLILHHCDSSFLRNHMTQLLFKIGQMIPASKTFMISLLTTSFKFEFSLLYCSIEDFDSSSRGILCMQKCGDIPEMSSREQKRALRYLCSLFCCKVSSVLFKLALTTTG